MSDRIKVYIADILNECGMDRNQEAQDMLLGEFTHIYEECLRKHDMEYAEYVKEKEKKRNELPEHVDKYGYFKNQAENCELPYNEAAFQEAKEKFGVYAAVDRAYMVTDTYRHYQKMKKMSITVLRALALISCLIAVYGIAFANDVDSKILTLTLWVITIIISVSFAIVFGSTDSKAEKLFLQFQGRFKYFYIKKKDNITEEQKNECF